jgi:hypothetical protein
MILLSGHKVVYTKYFFDAATSEGSFRRSLERKNPNPIYLFLIKSCGAD